MEATEQFKMRIRPEVNRALEAIAKHEGRSKANVVTMLILERAAQQAGALDGGKASAKSDGLETALRELAETFPKRPRK